MALPQRHKITPVIAAAYCLSIVVATHIPMPHWITRTGFSDKTMHYFAYFILACLLWFAVSPYKKANWRQFRPWLIFLIVILYGIFDEVVQGFVGRSPDLFDFLADIVGSLTGFVMVSFVSFGHIMLLMTIISAFALPGITNSWLAVSTGPGDMIISFIAFLCLSAGWILYKHLILNLRLGRACSVITSFILPAAVLAGVKLFCIFRDTDFRAAAIIAATAGIFTATFIASFFTVADRPQQY